jgi:CRISPR-associated protein Cas1
VIKKIIEISQAKRHLAVRLGQLIISENHTELSTIPCEDIGILLIDHPAVTYTHSVFTELIRCGAAVVFCGGNHHPTGMLLPIEGNTVQTERFRQQIEAKEPTKKQLWRQLVRAKIKHQAKVAGEDSDVYKELIGLRERVRSGDPDNIEAQASKKFWPAFVTTIDFKRNPEGTPPNNLLNYGYTVMRAAVARALCSAGLHPSIGLHHCNKYNAFCLADDCLEPFRGFVELKVKQICESQTELDELTQPIKAQLLEVLYEEVMIGEMSGPLMVGLHRTAASLVRCFAGEQKEMDLPVL